MAIDRTHLLSQIEIEAQLTEILSTEARTGVHAKIKHAQAGWEAVAARHAALQQLLDIIDERAGKGE